MHTLLTTVYHNLQRSRLLWAYRISFLVRWAEKKFAYTNYCKLYFQICIFSTAKSPHELPPTSIRALIIMYNAWLYRVTKKKILRKREQTIWWYIACYPLYSFTSHTPRVDSCGDPLARSPNRITRRRALVCGSIYLLPSELVIIYLSSSFESAIIRIIYIYTTESYICVSSLQLMYNYAKCYTWYKQNTCASSRLQSIQRSPNSLAFTFFTLSKLVVTTSSMSNAQHSTRGKRI